MKKLAFFAVFIFILDQVCMCVYVCMRVGAWYEILSVSVSKEKMYSTQMAFALLNVRREHLHAFLLAAYENILILAGKMIHTSYCYTRHHEADLIA